MIGVEIPFSRDFSVERMTSPLTVVAGLQVPGAIETLTTSGCVQPATPEEILEQPEGVRSSEMIKAYTQFRCFTDRPGFSADRLIVDSVRYKVVRVENYTISGGAIGLPYFKVMATNADEEDS